MTWLPNVRILVQSARPPFLLLAVVAVALGVVLAHASGQSLSPVRLLVIALAGLTGHVAVNIFNEVQDFRSGLDLLTRRTPFSGGSGALPRRPDLLPHATALGVLALAMTVLSGIWLAATGSPLLWWLGGFGVVLVLGYTPVLTRHPWLCLMAPGLGFSLVIGGGSYLAAGGQPSEAALWLLSPLGLLASALLLVNQFPDAEPDEQIGRRHFLIVYGPERAAVCFLLLLLLAFLLPVLAVWLDLLPVSLLMPLVLLPLAVSVGRGLWRHRRQPEQLLPVMAGQVLLTLLVPGLQILALVLMPLSR